MMLYIATLIIWLMDANDYPLSACPPMILFEKAKSIESCL